jgi:hypothetical protein
VGGVARRPGAGIPVKGTGAEPLPRPRPRLHDGIADCGADTPPTDRSAIETSDATLQVDHDHAGEPWLFGSHELRPDGVATYVVDALVQSGNDDGYLAVS